MYKAKYENWRELVTECTKSEKSALSWCKDKGIAYSTYRTWRKKLKESNEQPEDGDVTTVKWARVAEPGGNVKELSPPPTEITLTYGNWSIAVNSGFDSLVLREVMKTVEATC